MPSHEGEHPGPAALPDTICPLPWLNLSTDVNGSSRPCCKFAQPSPDSAYQLTNLRDGDLEEVWNGPAMRRLRQDFRAGVRPGECASCWNEEAAGVPSFRQTYRSDRGIHTEPDYASDTPAHPAALDLKLTNACNLKCRICGPVASSLWLREELAVGGEHADPYLIENKDYFRANKITGDPVNREVLRRWLPHLDHLELTGGEPMLSRENREVLELIVAEGRPEQMTLLLTTNATVVDDRMLDLLGAFGSVAITLSIDDIGERFEYERAPGRWIDTEPLIRRYAAMTSDRLHVGINCSVSPFNVWYLPEIVDWLAGDERLAPIHLNLNLVHYPRHYCIQVLPDALKEVVAARLRRHLLDHGGRCGPAVADQVLEVIDFLAGGHPGDADEWHRGLEVTRHRDEIRGERFAATFPEWTAEIERWAPERTTVEGDLHGGPDGGPEPEAGARAATEAPRRRLLALPRRRRRAPAR